MVGESDKAALTHHLSPFLAKDAVRANSLSGCLEEIEFDSYRI
jgi:hypothetical protein